MQCQLKCTGKQDPWSWTSFGGWRRRRGGVTTRSSSLRADCSGEGIPIGLSKYLRNHFEAMADSDLETLGSEGRTQCACHGFSVAKVAHIFILCLNETGAPGLALLTRSFGAKGC
jgi:hypothetical protein